MRTHKQNKPRKLYCSVNTTTRHHSNNPVLNIAGNVIVKESGMNYWPSASQYMADRSMAETTHHCFIF